MSSQPIGLTFYTGAPWRQYCEYIRAYTAAELARIQPVRR